MGSLATLDHHGVRILKVDREAGERHRDEPAGGPRGPDGPRAVPGGGGPRRLAHRRSGAPRARRRQPLSRVRTGGRAEARAHLEKAREFMQAADAALREGWPNAAAGSAVTAAINAKDALCPAMVGRTTAADDHRSAVGELRSLGAAGTEPANALDRLLGLKDRAQYDRRSLGAAEAHAAVRRAATIVQAAERALSSLA